jgi:ribonucleoside-diphosphate reductase alpha chain
MALESQLRKVSIESKLTENAKRLFERKYLSRNDSGQINETIDQRIEIICNEVANVEKLYGKNKEEIENIKNQFYEMMHSLSFLPGGRILSNVGSEIKSLFNCYVLEIKDEMEDIYKTIANAAIIQKSGGGIGINYSTLRPRGYYVKKSKGIASGPLSFMKVFDQSTTTINSGNRRGANMGVFDINHPDVIEIIYSKSKKLLENFNISMGITDEFMNKYKNDEYYALKFNNKTITLEKLIEINKNIKENAGDANIGKKATPGALKLNEDNTKIINNYTGKEIGIVDEGIIKLSAKKVMNIIATLAHARGDPGVLFLDNINKDNPLISQGYINATNPCGEQPLLPYGACDLGSINLAAMLDENNEINYTKLEKTVNSAVRFLDNINDLNKGPLPEIEKNTKSRRRIGLGVMGFADLLMESELAYDSLEGRNLAEKIMGFINDKAKLYSVKLSEEKGVFEEFENSNYNNGNLEDRVRNLTRTTIAPTGSISMVLNVNGGIEPYYSNIYYKKIRGGKALPFVNPVLIKKLKKYEIYSEELIEKIKKNKGSIQNIEEIPNQLKSIFKTSHELDYNSQLDMQLAFQKHIDNAVSKTVNLTFNSTIQDFLNIYVGAHERGLKGTTIYRDGSRNLQVLNTSEEKEEKKINNLQNGFRKPKKVPSCLPSIKIKQKSPLGTIYTLIPFDPITYHPKEIFAQVGKSGQDRHANLESICRMSSLALRLGSDPYEVIKQLKGIGSNNSMISREGKIFSLPDAIGRALEKYMILKEKNLLKSVLLGEINDLDKMMEGIEDELRKGKPSNNSLNLISSSKNILEKNDEPKSLQIICKSCGEGYIIKEEGCSHCTSCDYNACG